MDFFSVAKNYFLEICKKLPPQPIHHSPRYLPPPLPLSTSPHSRVSEFPPLTSPTTNGRLFEQFISLGANDGRDHVMLAVVCTLITALVVYPRSVVMAEP